MSQYSVYKAGEVYMSDPSFSGRIILLSLLKPTYMDIHKSRKTGQFSTTTEPDVKLLRRLRERVRRGFLQSFLVN